MKQLFSLIMLFLILAGYIVQKLDSNEIIQMVVALPELNSKELQKNLETDIYNLSGIQFLETSLMSKTMMLNYNSRKVSPNDVENILHKWGCNSSESSFRKIDP